jgi:c-di-GMP-binding flagellar brake protein YcgR
LATFLSVGEKLRKRDVRKYPRVPTRFPVECSLGEKTFRTHASTLGGGGLFIEDGQQLQPREAEIQVRFRPAKHLPYFQARARICYVLEGKGSGVEFTQIVPEDRQLILRLIHHKTASRREFPRVPLATQIIIEDSMALAFSRDLSVGGMFIETKVPCEVGTPIDLRFHLNDDTPIVIASALVRYVIPNMGMGVQFTEMEWEDRNRIKQFVAASAPVEPAASTAS